MPKEPLNEKRIEELYWSFDSERKRTGDERRAFKGVMRKFAHEELKRYLLVDTTAEAMIER